MKVESARASAPAMSPGSKGLLPVLLLCGWREQGVQVMDRAPYLMDGGRWGYRMGPAEIHDSMLRDGLDDAFSGKHSGWHTEDLVKQAQLTREAQDRFAARSRWAWAQS